MKKYPKLVQCDKRGQIVIPKEIRQDLDIDEGTGFFMYSISDEGILLKKVEARELDENNGAVREIMEKSDKISLPKDKVKQAIDDYRKKKKGGLDIV